jgi:hypothetical protein
MYTWCKKKGANLNHYPFQYQTANSDVTGAPPAICATLPQPHVHNRGIPPHLVDVETRLKGTTTKTGDCAEPCLDTATNFFLRGLQGMPRHQGHSAQPIIVHEAVRGNDATHGNTPPWRNFQRSSSLADSCAMVEGKLRL